MNGRCDSEPDDEFKGEPDIAPEFWANAAKVELEAAVAEGKLQDKTFFIADRILAKHDENYMPPELKNIKQNAK